MKVVQPGKEKRILRKSMKSHMKLHEIKNSGEKRQREDINTDHTSVSSPSIVSRLKRRRPI